MTLPVGFGTAAGVPAALVTNTLSWTTSPADAVVITAWLALWMSVRTALSAQSFWAGTEFPPVPFVVRVSVTVLTHASSPTR